MFVLYKRRRMASNATLLLPIVIPSRISRQPSTVNVIGTHTHGRHGCQKWRHVTANNGEKSQKTCCTIAYRRRQDENVGDLADFDL